MFIIIPMLNPDGVINGNYRCSLAGCDLNRNWDNPLETLHPTIFNSKKLIKHMGMQARLSLYCDFHGHSKKNNSFFYGCHNKDKPFASREFPYILQRICPFFNFKDCNFQTKKGKEGTARVALYQELGCRIDTIYTHETSFSGPSNAKL